MARYILARVIQAVPVLLITSAGIFLLIYLVPGDPAITVAGPDATAAEIAAIRRRMGLDQPLLIQYLRWLGNIAQGDLGVSYVNRAQVAELLGSRIVVTAHLAVATMLVAPVLAVPLGIMTATRPRSVPARLAVAFNALAMAIPAFWLGILLVLIVGLELKWLPTTGHVSFFDDPLASIRFLILPTLTLGAYAIAILSRFTRAAVLEVLNEDYVRTARAKGLNGGAVMRHHVLPNALVTIVTIMGIQFGHLLGGAVIVEAIFGYPGLGRGLLESILLRDYTVVQATILFVVVVFIVVNLITDLLYVYLDPRIRYR